MAGNLHLPNGSKESEKYAAIVCVHPGGGVKEQTAGVYAQRLAEQGFVALAYDSSYQGASGGMPHFLDEPMNRVADVYSAVDCLMTLPYVDAERIGVLGICAGGGMAVKAASVDRRIKAVGTASAVNVGAATRKGWASTVELTLGFTVSSTERIATRASLNRSDEVLVLLVPPLAHGLPSPVGSLPHSWERCRRKRVLSNWDAPRQRRAAPRCIPARNHKQTQWLGCKILLRQVSPRGTSPSFGQAETSVIARVSKRASSRSKEAMTSRATPSLWAVLAAAVVVGFAASLVGCGSLGPIRPVAVSDVRSVAGTWQGVLYKSNSQPDYVELTIREDGSYEVVSRHTIGKSSGQGRIVVSDGHLIFQGEKGHGVGTLLRTRGGDRMMDIQATLSDNSTLSATLSPSR